MCGESEPSKTARNDLEKRLNEVFVQLEQQHLRNRINFGEGNCQLKTLLCCMHLKMAKKNSRQAKGSELD